MISNQARDGFDRLLSRALKSSLSASEEDAVAVRTVDNLKDSTASTIAVLTISSYLFRAIVMLHFSEDSATMAHVARLNKVAVHEMSGQAFHDAIAECGNLFCGILNRDLGGVFPHIGMSTPNIIDTRCINYLDMLKGGHIRHFSVDIAAHPRFHVSLCVCDYADLDFAINAAEESESTGELELF